MRLFVGSYTVKLPHVDGRGAGVSVLRLDAETASLRPVAVAADIVNPSYLAVSRDGRMVYAVEELDERDGASIVRLAFDFDTSTLRVCERYSALGDCPCHLSLADDEQRAFLANYVDGSIVSYALDRKGKIVGGGQKVTRQGSGPNKLRQLGPHAHCIIQTIGHDSVLVCDAGTDEILRYPFTKNGLADDPNLVLKAPGGTLPRHLVQSGDGEFLHVVHELGCTVRSYAKDNGQYRLVGEVSTLAVFDGRSACAAIKLHPNGRFLYVSNRGDNSIAAFRVETDGSLSSKGLYTSHGETPRDMAIDPTGRYLVVANQDSHTLALFAIDPDSGGLHIHGELYTIGSPACVVFRSHLGET